MATRNHQSLLKLLDIQPVDDNEIWQDRALCAEVGSEFWFPEKGGTTKPAKDTCMQCPVRAKKLGGTGECLEYALEHDERFGIWGGYSERERRRLKRGEDVAPARYGVRREFL